MTDPNGPQLTDDGDGEDPVVASEEQASPQAPEGPDVVAPGGNAGGSPNDNEPPVGIGR